MSSVHIYILGYAKRNTSCSNKLENKYLTGAPKANREKIKRVIQIYRDNRNVTRNTAEKVVMFLYLPSASGP